MFLAKSENLETIQEHTNALIENMYLLKSVHPNPQNVDWEVLYLACEYHDLGKLNPVFQKKIWNRVHQEKKKDENDWDNEIPHNYLSTAFIDTKHFKDLLGESRLTILINAVAYHHDRKDYVREDIVREIEVLKKETLHYEGGKYNHIKAVSTKYLSKDKIEEKEIFYYDYIIIKGLLNRLDYAASAHIPVERKNDFLTAGLINLNYKWNELQSYMKIHQNDNVVVIAETGFGKTEGALLWIGDHKGFFTLPLRTAINAIYDRIKNQIVPIESHNFFSILHGESRAIILNESSRENGENKYLITRQLAVPLTVTTIDQIFKFVFRYQNFESLFATMSFSKIVIDEIQMYDPSLLAYLMYGLKMIEKVGGKYAILTATMPSFLIDFMKNLGLNFNMPEKPFLSDKKRHHLKVIESDFEVNKIISLSKDKKCLIICNTIKKATELYTLLKVIAPEKNLKLLHSRFIQKDRSKKENEIKMDLEVHDEVIWVTTQIVEASLDIDYDLLFTELSDLAGLFQRLGRCNRKGEKDTSRPNCFVYLGAKKCSGVGSVTDEEIHRISKKYAQQLSGLITEEDKMKIIEKAYTYEAIKDSQYYRTFVRSYDMLENLMANTVSKSEVYEMFRNIQSISVIPKPTYDQYKEKIDAMIKSYKEVEGSQTYRVRSDILNVVKEYTVSVPPYMKKHMESYLIFDETSKIQIPLLTCEYDNEKGIQLITTENSGNFDW